MHSRVIRRPSRRRLLRVAGVASAGILAGCLDGETADDGDADSGDGTDEDGNDSDSRSGDGDGTDDPIEATWEPFEFDRPVAYTFDTYSADDGPGTLVWDVTGVTDDGATVTLSYETAETQFETTVTGTKDDLQSQLLLTPAGPFVLSTLFSPTMGYYEGRHLSVGEEWSYSSPDGSMRFELTERRAYAGVDCYASVTEVDEALVHEGCFSPALELAPYTVYYDENGDRAFEMTLVSLED
ncbi:hypothetical protein [Halosolutus gelatinilyticus]|uniref:hypothetical protein n=1 Tax=Halosolutus gelatinilyticus TaxID=2931975 RepID=UPI001FF31406|nr:hypothetical protein [Halosolutus gelatinilyticus]